MDKMDTSKMWEEQEKYLLRIPEGRIPFSPAQYGERLKMLRLEQGYSRQDVATVLGCTQQNVQKIELGKNKKISLKLLPRFAKLYGCTCAYLMGFFEKDTKDAEDKDERKNQDLANRSKFLYYGKTYSFPVIRYERDEIVAVSDVIQAYKRDPVLFSYYLELSKATPEKRRIGREMLEKLLDSKE